MVTNFVTLKSTATARDIIKKKVRESYIQEHPTHTDVRIHHLIDYMLMDFFGKDYDKIKTEVTNEHHHTKSK